MLSLKTSKLRYIVWFYIIHSNDMNICKKVFFYLNTSEKTLNGGCKFLKLIKQWNDEINNAMYNFFLHSFIYKNLIGWISLIYIVANDGQTDNPTRSSVSEDTQLIKNDLTVVVLNSVFWTVTNFQNYY